MATKIAVTRVTCDTSTGDQDITTADLSGGTPEAALFIWTRATADGTATDHAVLGIGAATANDERWCCTVSSEHGLANTDTYRRGATDECVMILDPSDGSVDGEADFKEFIAGGCTITWGNAPTGAYLLTAVFFDDVSAFAGVFTQPNDVDDTEDVTAPGFEPDLVLFATHGTSFGDSAVARAIFSYGVAVNDGSDTQAAIMTHYADAASSGEAHATLNDGYAFGGLWTSYIEWAGLIGTFDSDGFTSTNKVGASGEDQVGYLAIAVSDVDVWSGIVDTPTDTGDDAQTGPGFTPQFAMLGLTHLQAVDSVLTTGDAGSIGISVFDADDEYCNSFQDEDASATTDTQSLSDDTAINLPEDDGTQGHVAAFKSFDANGWTLTWSATLGAARKLWGLAIETAASGETHECEGTAAGDSLCTVNLTRVACMAANAVGDSAVMADVNIIHGVIGTAAGDAVTAAALFLTLRLAGTASGEADYRAPPVTVLRNVAAQAVGDSAVSASLSKSKLLSATAVGDSAVSASANSVRGVKANAVGDSAISVSANAFRGAKATAVGDSTVTARLNPLRTIKAVAVGDASVSADLSRVWAARHPAHEVILYNSSGVQQSRLRKWAAVEYTVRCSNVGDCSISAHKDVNGADDLVSDNRVEIYRRGNRVFAGRFDWENPSYADSGDPSAFRTTRGADFNRLPRRHVLRNVGSACTAAPDDVMKHFARYAWGGSAAASRQLSGFSVSANEAAALGTYHIAGEPQDTAMDVIERVGKACSVDWWVNADVANGTYVFRTGYPRRGTDKSSDIVFTVYRGNVKGFEYTLDTVDKANLAYVGGPGQGSSQTIGTYYAGTAEATGWDRWEAFVRAPDAEYADELTVYGSAYLSTFGSGVENVTFDVHEISGYRWPENYDLGDLVTVYDPKFSKTVVAKVEEVSVKIDDRGVETLSLTVGKPRPTEWDKLQAHIGPYSTFGDDDAPLTPTGGTYTV